MSYCNELHQNIKKGDINRIVEILYTNSIGSNDFKTCLNFLDPEKEEEFIHLLYSHPYFKLDNFELFLKILEDELILKNILENIDLSLIQSIFLLILEKIIYLEYYALFLSFYKRVYNYDRREHKYILNEYINKILTKIEKRKIINLSKLLLNEFNIKFDPKFILENDIEVLFDEDVLTYVENNHENCIDFFINNTIFGCFLRYLTEKSVDSKFIDESKRKFESRLHNLCRYTFAEKNVEICNICEFLNIDIIFLLKYDQLNGIIKKINIGRNPIHPYILRINLRVARRVNWCDYHYENIHKMCLPLWKNYWMNKIKKDFPKEKIVYFYEDIFENENVRFVYEQIQKSIEYDINSENFHEAKNEFYNIQEYN